MNTNNQDSQIESMRPEREQRREFVALARKGFRTSFELARSTGVPRRKLVVAHEEVMRGVVGLWYLGLWPKDIADFIGQITELEVMGVLRRHILITQGQLHADLIKTLTSTD
jgi:hypothetical protein